MTGLEIVVGEFLVAWAARKARRVGKRVDTEIDQALDLGLDRLHELVAGKLGGDPALAKLAAEIEQSGEASSRTQERVRLALEDAAETDPGFASDLRAVVQELQGMQRQAGVAVAGQQGVVVSGNVQADRGAVAIGGVSGSTVSIGLPPGPSAPGGNKG
ncbi:hypothetical protein K7472_07955 [Streptomyces sp. PTM05]|uniref:Uncharacterized protein n=1 Tax=Streptantibioticus parmotrematis TaxID=2873249 RepID=A0ABS7QPB9_9ACTN|nr:hypothetical protein [Streptantibioticus parmotrematis]MBY8884778.1 hypothetical protein [Streptantibioticus parmotrematis]